MPYKRLLTSLCKYIPQLFSFAITRVEVIGNNIRFISCSIKASNPVSIWVCTSCQRRPHWRSNCRHSTDHCEIMTCRTTLNQFFNVWHLPFIHQSSRKTWFQTVHTKNHNLICQCFSCHKMNTPFLLIRNYSLNSENQILNFPYGTRIHYFLWVV